MEAENLMVRPIDVIALAMHIDKLHPLPNNQKYNIEKTAFVLLNDKILNVATDNECCYEILEKKLWSGIIQYVYEVGCRIETKTDEGISFSMYVDFWFPISIDELKQFLSPAESLKDFMVGRYDYNPRISSNTRSFVEFINSQLTAPNNKH